METVYGNSALVIEPLAYDAYILLWTCHLFESTLFCKTDFTLKVPQLEVKNYLDR